MNQNQDRVAELHRLADEDYAKGQQERARVLHIPTYSALAAAEAVQPPPEPSDLDVAIRVAQDLLDSDQLLSVREALRLLLRALGAEPAPAGDPEVVVHENGLTFRVIPADSPFARIARNVRQLKMADGTVWTVGAPIGWDGIEAAWHPQEPQPTPTDRCPAAHPNDPTPCDGPPVVTILDAANAGANGCAHHGARLLASLGGGRVYPLPDAPAGSAVEVFKAADRLQPFPWVTGALPTRLEQLSRAENRQRGERA